MQILAEFRRSSWSHVRLQRVGVPSAVSPPPLVYLSPITNVHSIENVQSQVFRNETTSSSSHTKRSPDEDKIIRRTKRGRNTDDVYLLTSNKARTKIRNGGAIRRRKWTEARWIQLFLRRRAAGGPRAALIKRKSKRQSPARALCKFTRIDFHVDNVRIFTRRLFERGNYETIKACFRRSFIWGLP